MTDTDATISWIEETAKAVGLARNAGEARKQADLLGESKAEFGRILSEFRNLHDSAVVVRAIGWEGRLPSPDLPRDLDEALQTLDSRPLNRLQRALDQFGRDLATSLKEHWTGHATRQLGDVADLLTLSETLSGVEGIADVSHELSATLRELARSQATLPTSQSVEMLTKAERLLRQLESALKPDEVRRFLSAVARGGAPVATVTSDVKKWLVDHNSLDRFRVVAGTPVGDSDV
jgi:hypothetical protein